MHVVNYNNIVVRNTQNKSIRVLYKFSDAYRKYNVAAHK